MARPGQSVADERTDQRADAASGHQESEADVARVEDLAREDGDHREHAGRRAESELHRDERPHAPVLPRVADRLAGRVDDPDVFVVFTGGGEGSPDAEQQERRERERDGVDREGHVASEDRGHHAAKRRAHREHRAPERSAEGVRGRQILWVDDVG